MSTLTDSAPLVLTSSFETELLERAQTAMADRESLTSNSWLGNLLEALASVADSARNQTCHDLQSQSQSQSRSHLEPTGRRGVVAETRPGTWGGSVRLRDTDVREIASEYRRLDRTWKQLRTRLLALQEKTSEQTSYDPVSLSMRCEVVGWIRDWHEYRAALQENSHLERVLASIPHDA
ncbi:MAG: hypothetical protein O3A00_07425 [Planctomycetota bacterium]|nr:hypothetical protein [Planctomycetota bacterium]